MTRLRRMIKRSISEVIERQSSGALFRLGAAMTRSNAAAQSIFLRKMLTHSKPDWRRHVLFETFQSRLPSRDVIAALAATKRSRNAEWYTSLEQLTSRPSVCVDYTRAFVEQRFVDAYDIWLHIPEVPPALESLAGPNPDSLTHTIAVVLPGSTDGAYGCDIDGHDLVARTGIVGPTADDIEFIGSRFDVSFLNPPRFQALVQSPEPISTSAARYVVDSKLRRLTIPEWLTTPIHFELTMFDPPASPYSYAPLRIVPYCHQRGILPRPYFADFYLGDVAYQAAHYDPKFTLNTSFKHTRSYLLHDVFFTHAALQK